MLYNDATVLWAFWARRQQVVATLFIVVLAAVDFSTCLIVMPFTVYMELKHFHVQLDATCKLYQVLFFTELRHYISHYVSYLYLRQTLIDRKLQTPYAMQYILQCFLCITV